MLGSLPTGIGSVPTAGSEDGTGGGGSGITRVTSPNGTVLVTNEFGPTVLLEVAAVAPWSLLGARVYAVSTSGSDLSTGFADSADQTQAGIAAATVAAGAVAKRTMTGLRAILPPVWNGRLGFIVIEGAIGDGLSLVGLDGYNIVIRGTGTVASAGAVRFTGTTADLISEGETTPAGLNAAGYNPTGAGTSFFLTVQKNGGGAPGFAAQPAKPYGCRLRGSATTTTVALRNKCITIVGVYGGNQLQLAESITVATTDVLFIEEPSASITSLTVERGGQLDLVGIDHGTVTALSPDSLRFSSCIGTANLNGGTARYDRLFPLFTSPPVGGTRHATIEAQGGTFLVAEGSLCGPGGSSFQDMTNLDVANANSFATVTISGCDAILDGNAVNPNSSKFGGPFTGGLMATSILTVLALDGARQAFGWLGFPSSNQPIGMEWRGCCDLLFGDRVDGGVTGSAKTNVGIDAHKTAGGRFIFNDVNHDADHAMTMSGANGDTYWGTNTTVASQPIYASYVGLGQVNGVLVLPSGMLVTPLAGASPDQFSHRTGASLCTIFANTSGANIPVDGNGRGLLVRFGNIGDAHDGTVAHADTFDHAAGQIGQAVGLIRDAQSGFVIIAGVVTINWTDLAPGPGPGGFPVYLSDTTAGMVRPTPPASGVVRQLGWALGEATCVLVPDNHFQNPAMPDFSPGNLNALSPLRAPVAVTFISDEYDFAAVAGTTANFPKSTVPGFYFAMIDGRAISTVKAGAVTTGGAVKAGNNGAHDNVLASSPIPASTLFALAVPAEGKGAVAADNQTLVDLTAPIVAEIVTAATGIAMTWKGRLALVGMLIPASYTP